MNIPIFLAAGMAAEFVLALIRPLRGATRGLVCWSVSAVVLSMCCAVYFISSGDITFDLPGAIRGIGGAGVLVLIAALRTFLPLPPEPTKAGAGSAALGTLAEHRAVGCSRYTLRGFPGSVAFRGARHCGAASCASDCGCTPADSVVYEVRRSRTPCHTARKTRGAYLMRQV